MQLMQKMWAKGVGPLELSSRPPTTNVLKGH